MPSGTTLTQFIADLTAKKSTIARMFDWVYQHCQTVNASKQNLLPQLRAWVPGTKPGQPNGLPDLTIYSPPPAPKPPALNKDEIDHICAWPGAGVVRNAMVRALEDPNWDIVFFWNLEDDLSVTDSRSVVEPTDAGNPLPGPPATDLALPPGTVAPGLITVTFLTPRNKVREEVRRIRGQNVVHIRMEV